MQLILTAVLCATIGLVWYVGCNFFSRTPDDQPDKNGLRIAFKF